MLPWQQATDVTAKGWLSSSSTAFGIPQSSSFLPRRPRAPFPHVYTSPSARHRRRPALVTKLRARPPGRFNPHRSVKWQQLCVSCGGSIMVLSEPKKDVLYKEKLQAPLSAPRGANPSYSSTVYQMALCWWNKTPTPLYFYNFTNKFKELYHHFKDPL